MTEAQAIGGLYTVRLQVEGLRHVIETVICDHDGAIRATIEHEVKAVIANFDFAGVVQQEAKRVVAECVRRCIQDAISNALWQEPMKAMVTEAVTQAIRAALGVERDKV